MLKKERQAYILRQVHLHNKVLSSTLSQEINVSEDTIRRDLQELANDSKLIKVHGGALSTSYNKFYTPDTHVYSQDQKQLIARKAASLVEDGMCVLTSGGTTIIEMARSLRPDLRATFLSGSIQAVVEFMNHPQIEVVLIGDKVSKNAKITVGGEAIARISQIRADMCFLGVNAIHPDHGISDNDWDVVQVKKAMVRSAQKVVCLTISEKINSLQPIKIANLSQIHTLITELDPSDPLLQPYAEAGIRLL